MTVAWTLYALLVGTLLAAAAIGVERVFRMMGWPGRGIWAGALLLTGLLVNLAPYRAPALSRPVAGAERLMPSEGARYHRDVARSEGVLATLQAIRGTIKTSIQHTLAAADRRVPASFGRYFAAAWLSLSGLLLLLFITVHGRFHSLRRRWPSAEFHGIRVRLAPQMGPVVIGLVRPEIVIPQWLLRYSADEQRLVLAHECEHARAGDPLLLALACTTTVLLPWHPAVWWMFSRLRLAVELDCDARVLRRGIAPRRYGDLLIMLAGRCHGFSVGALALAGEAFQLRRRLLAMRMPRRRFAHLDAGVVGLFAFFSVTLACEAEIPRDAATHVRRREVARSALVSRAEACAELQTYVSRVATDSISTLRRQGRLQKIVDSTVADMQRTGSFVLRVDFATLPDSARLLADAAGPFCDTAAGLLSVLEQTVKPEFQVAMAKLRLD